PIYQGGCGGCVSLTHLSPHPLQDGSGLGDRLAPQQSGSALDRVSVADEVGDLVQGEIARDQVAGAHDETTRALFELLTEDLRQLGRVEVQRNAPLPRPKHRHRRCRAETTFDPNLEILEIEWHEIQRIGERPIVGHDYQSARTLPRLVSDMPAVSP